MTGGGVTRRGGLIGPSAWLFGATAISNLCNLLYHLYMVRHLAPEHYAMLTALIALMTVMAVPATTVQTTTSHRVAQLNAQAAWEALRADLRRRFALAGLAGAGLWLLVAALHRWIMAYLQAPDVPAVVFSWGGTVALGFVVPVVWGSLQGLQAFSQLGANLMINALMKLGLGVLLVGAGWAVLGAMHGFVLALALALGIGVVQIRALLHQRHPRAEEETPWWGRVVAVVVDGLNESWVMIRGGRGIPVYAVVVALSVMAYTSLTNIDVVLAKHYLAPAVAGQYAVGAMVSRMVLFLPMALSMVLFPKVAHATALGQDATPLLRLVTMATILISGAACAVCLRVPARLMLILAGTVYPQAIPIVRLLAVAMACMAVANLYLVYLLAVQTLRATTPFLVAAASQVAGIALWHASMSQMAGVTVTVTGCLGVYSALRIFGGSWMR